MRDCFYFKSKNHRLFACLHYPKSIVNKRHGVVLCAPFAEEKLWSHRIFVNFAEMLSSQGYSVLRFDYMGDGDSEGNFEESDIETRLQDIEQAVKTIKEEARVEKVGLLGLRLGATLCALFAEEGNAADCLILWEPVVNVENYLKQCLRSSLSTQMATYRKIIYTREQMISDFEKGKSVNFDGYLMSSNMYMQGSKIDLLNYPVKYSKPVIIFNITKNQNKTPSPAIQKLQEKYYRLNPKSKILTISEKTFWSDTKTYNQKVDTLFNSTTNCFKDLLE